MLQICNPGLERVKKKLLILIQKIIFKHLKSHNFLFRLAKRWRSAPEFFKLSNVGPTATFDDRKNLEITKHVHLNSFEKS